MFMFTDFNFWWWYVQVIIISYAGSVFFNMCVDDDLVDMYPALPKLYLDELREMAEAFEVPSDEDSMLADTI